MSEPVTDQNLQEWKVLAERVLSGPVANHFEPEQVYAYIIKRLVVALDAARAENAATAAQIEIAKRLLPPLDETPAETAMLDAIFGTPTVGEESRYFDQFLRESEGE